MANQIVEKIQIELSQNADPKTLKSSAHFFKEPIQLHGIKSADLNKIATENFKDIKNKSKEEIFEICEELWKSGFFEEQIIACNWSDQIHSQFVPGDFEIFKRWVNKYVSNWATCDTFCNHTVGTFIEMFPGFIVNLKQWAKSSNLWIRRASAVSLIIPAKRGKFISDILEIAEILLYDKEDMVQKGYGWMLKAASQSSLQNQKAIFDFVMKHKATMPRTALRYAIEKMPKELKAQAMSK